MRRALVTGGGSGIGLAIAKKLAETCDVTVLGRDKAKLEASGFDAIICDVADSAGVAKLLTHPFDIVVNNAGIVRSAPFHKLSDDDWENMLATNVMGAVHVTRAALPAMRERGWGRIVNIASTAALKGYPYVSAYVASKHALLGLTRALALELARTGITVNAVCPGYTDTEIVRAAVGNIATKTKRTEAEARAELAGANPQRRLIAPVEIASAVAYLVSEDAGGVTGQVVAIDGGETA